VIAFASRTLRNAEKRYFTTEKEALAVVYAVNKFKTYLLGVPFTIWVDHKSLSFIKQCKLHNDRLARWILLLQEYNFDIRYVPGRDNIVPDALSRAPVGNEHVRREDAVLRIASLHKCTREPHKQIRNVVKQLTCEQQRLDPKIETLVATIQTDTLAVNQKQNWLLHQNILFHKSKSDCAWKVYVPEQLINPLVTNYHEAYGHFGAHKIFNLIREFFFFPNMRRRIVSILRTCDLCQKSKINVSGMAGEMATIIPDKQNAIVATDLFGPLPQSRGGVCFVLVFIDLFTKFVTLYALKKATSKARNRFFAKSGSA
jgi:hypothetical protein